MSCLLRLRFSANIAAQKVAKHANMCSFTVMAPVSLLQSPVYSGMRNVNVHLQ